MNNKTKTILLASLIVAMIIPLTAMEIFVTADKEEQGKTIINHIGVPLVHTPDWKERDNLMKQKETTTDEIEKRQIESEIDILHSKIQADLDSKYDESKYEIAMEKKRLLTDFVTENRQTMGYREAFMYLPTVAHGYDYTNNSLRVAIDHKYFNEPNLEIYEERIRSIVGHDIDITFHPGSVGRLDSCSSRTTGECEPIDGGVAFDSDDLLVCTVMFAATYNGNTGFVTAGHCVDGLGNHDINQSPSSSKDLGSIEQETFVSGTTFDCDCAFISEKHSRRSMGDGAFGYRDPSTTGTPFVNMGITMSGAYSGLKTGFVYELDEDYHVDTTGDGMTDTIINDTIVGTYTSAARDSGAPVLSGNSLVGMHLGTDGTHTRFIATSVIESEFSGLTWDY